MKTMKKLLGLMLAAAMLLSIAACAATTNDPTPSTDPAPAAEEPTQTAEPSAEKESLEVWAISSGTETDQYLRDFASAHPEVDYTITFYSDDDLKTQSKIALDSGIVPDVFFGHAGADFSEYYASGVLKDITQLIKDNGTYDRIESGYYGPYTVDDKIYGYPEAVLTPWQSLYVNRDIFDACGITEDPTTVDELIATCNTIHENGYDPIAIGDKDGWPAVILCGDYYAQQTADYGELNKILTGEDTFPGNEVFRNAFATVVELGQNGAYMSGFSSTDHNTAIQAFAAGQTAMLYCGSWWSSIAGGTDNGFTLDVIQLPLMEGLTDNVSVQLCADIALLPTKDANESALGKFFDYISDGGYWTVMGNEYNSFTMVSSVNENLNLDPVFLKEPIIRQFDKPVLSPFFDNMFPAAVLTEMETAFQQAIAGEITVDQALENIQAVMDQNLG